MVQGRGPSSRATSSACKPAALTTERASIVSDWRPLRRQPRGVSVNELLSRADSRGRNLQGRRALHVWFFGEDLLRINEPQAFDPIFPALSKERLEFGLLASVFRHDEFPRCPMGHAVAFAELLGQAISLNTMTSFPGIGRVVDAGVDDAAVAGARGHAKLGILLHEEHVLPAA